MKTHFMLYASEIASICGLHKYCKPHEAFIKVWDRVYQEDICLQENESHELSKAEVEKDILTNDETIKFIDDASKADNISDINFKLENLDEIINPIILKLGEEQRSNVSEIIKSKIRCEFGNKQEESALTNYESTKQVKVNNRNDTFYKKPIYSCSEFKISLGGRVDGIKEDTVVEVKNRIRKFFDPLPLYDVTQLQIYLFLTDLKKGELVEQLKFEECEMKSTPIEYDESFIKDILFPKIIKFCTAMHELNTDEDLRIKYGTYSLCERQNFIDSMVVLE